MPTRSSSFNLFGGHGAGLITDPTVIAGCKLWLDATQVVADGNAANDGDAMAAWTDHSSVGAGVAQSSATLKPLYKTNIQNSKPAVRFDGVNDIMGGSTSGLFAVQGGDDLACTVVAAIKPKDLSTFNLCLFSWGASGSASRPFTGIYLLSGPGDITIDADGNTSSEVRPEPGTAHWTTDTSIVSSWVYSGTALDVFLNGAQVQTASALNTATKTNINQYAIGGLQRLTSTDYFHQYVFEIAVYDTALSAANRAKVEAYLNNKWAVY